MKRMLSGSRAEERLCISFMGALSRTGSGKARYPLSVQLAVPRFEISRGALLDLG